MQEKANNNISLKWVIFYWAVAQAEVPVDLQLKAAWEDRERILSSTLLLYTNIKE